jgi:hypothetical protein
MLVAPMANPKDQVVPDAQAVEPIDEGMLQSLRLGPPFAIVHDCELLERDDTRGIAGPALAVACDCGQPFRLDLTSGTKSECPKCARVYTHVLLIAADDNDEVVYQAFATIIQSNGFELNREGPEDEDDGDEDDQGDEDELDPEGEDKPER